MSTDSLIRLISLFRGKSTRRKRKASTRYNYYYKPLKPKVTPTLQRGDYFKVLSRERSLLKALLRHDWAIPNRSRMAIARRVYYCILPYFFGHLLYEPDYYRNRILEKTLHTYINSCQIAFCRKVRANKLNSSLVYTSPKYRNIGTSSEDKISFVRQEN